MTTKWLLKSNYLSTPFYYCRRHASTWRCTPELSEAVQFDTEQEAKDFMDKEFMRGFTPTECQVNGE